MSDTTTGEIPSFNSLLQYAKANKKAILHGCSVGIFTLEPKSILLTIDML